MSQVHEILDLIRQGHANKDIEAMGYDHSLVSHTRSAYGHTLSMVGQPPGGLVPKHIPKAKGVGSANKQLKKGKLKVASSAVELEGDKTPGYLVVSQGRAQQLHIYPRAKRMPVPELLYLAMDILAREWQYAGWDFNEWDSQYPEVDFIDTVLYHFLTIHGLHPGMYYKVALNGEADEMVDTPKVGGDIHPQFYDEPRDEIVFDSEPAVDDTIVEERMEVPSEEPRDLPNTEAPTPPTVHKPITVGDLLRRNL